MAETMGYDKFVAEAAYLRVLEERSAALEAHLAIEKPMQSSRPSS
jgi:hypothetical protein